MLAEHDPYAVRRRRRGRDHSRPLAVGRAQANCPRERVVVVVSAERRHVDGGGILGAGGRVAKGDDMHRRARSRQAYDRRPRARGVKHQAAIVAGAGVERRRVRYGHLVGARDLGGRDARVHDASDRLHRAPLAQRPRRAGLGQGQVGAVAGRVGHRVGVVGRQRAGRRVAQRRSVVAGPHAVRKVHAAGVPAPRRRPVGAHRRSRRGAGGQRQAHGRPRIDGLGEPHGYRNVRPPAVESVGDAGRHPGDVGAHGLDHNAAVAREGPRLAGAG